MNKIIRTDKLKEANNKEQPKLDKSENDTFPQEFEEQRSKNIRMKPQPFTKGKE